MEQNKELTPMMELMEFVENQQKLYIQLAKKDKTKRKEVDAILTATTFIKMKSKELLPKEKQVIEDAGNTCAFQMKMFIDKVNNMTDEELFELADKEEDTLGQDYYKNKYKQIK